MRRRKVVALAAALGAVALGGAGLAIAALPAGAAAAGCRVTYTITNQWPGGFSAGLSITNLGDAISSWTVGWTFANGQMVTQLWNGTVSQSGSAPTGGRR